MLHIVPGLSLRLPSCHSQETPPLFAAPTAWSPGSPPACSSDSARSISHTQPPTPRLTQPASPRTSVPPTHPPGAPLPEQTAHLPATVSLRSAHTLPLFSLISQPLPLLESVPCSAQLQAGLSQYFSLASKSQTLPEGQPHQYTGGQGDMSCSVMVSDGSPALRARPRLGLSQWTSQDRGEHREHGLPTQQPSNRFRCALTGAGIYKSGA